MILDYDVKLEELKQAKKAFVNGNGDEQLLTNYRKAKQAYEWAYARDAVICWTGLVVVATVITMIVH